MNFSELGRIVRVGAKVGLLVATVGIANGCDAKTFPGATTLPDGQSVTTLPTRGVKVSDGSETTIILVSPRLIEVLASGSGMENGVEAVGKIDKACKVTDIYPLPIGQSNTDDFLVRASDAADCFNNVK